MTAPKIFPRTKDGKIPKNMHAVVMSKTLMTLLATKDFAVPDLAPKFPFAFTGFALYEQSRFDALVLRCAEWVESMVPFFPKEGV